MMTITANANVTKCFLVFNNYDDIFNVYLNQQKAAEEVVRRKAQSPEKFFFVKEYQLNN